MNLTLDPVRFEVGPNGITKIDHLIIESTDLLMLPKPRELDVPTKELAHGITRLFDYFNDALFDGELGEPLPHPVLNFSRKAGGNRRRKNGVQSYTVAFFAPQAWKDPNGGEMLDEISLVPEWTNQDPIRVCSDLVHEMAHYLDHLNGTACKGGYHGRSWFTIMERLGLPGVEINGSKLTVTHDIEPGGAFDRAFRAMPGDLKLPFTTSRPKFSNDGTTKQTLQGKRAKYQCALCANERNGYGVMRGPSGMDLLCVTHNEPLHELGF